MALEGRAAALEALARGHGAVVWQRLIADVETPVSAALKLIEPGRGDWVLESRTGAIESSLAISQATLAAYGELLAATSITDSNAATPRATAEDSPLTPAFNQVVPALFGALGISYFRKHWKISIIPLAVIVIVLLINGSVGSGVLIPIGVVVALLSTHILYKKGWVK